MLRLHRTLAVLHIGFLLFPTLLPAQGLAPSSRRAGQPQWAVPHLSDLSNDSVIDQELIDPTTRDRARTTPIEAHIELHPATQVIDAPLHQEANDTSSQAVRFDSNVPSLRVSTSGPDTLIVGKPATYVISLLNLSDFDARDVVVRCSLPRWVELQQHQASVGDLNPARPNLEWKVDQIDAHGRQSLSLDLIPRTGNAFELNVDIAIQPTHSRTRIAVQEPKLDLKLQGPTDLVYGEPGVWQLLIENLGTGDAEDVKVDVFSGSNQIASTVVGRLRAGSIRPMELDLRATEVGTHTVQVVATGDLGLKDIEESRFVVRRGKLVLEFYGPEIEFADSESVYTVAIANTGDAPAKNVAIVLDLPEGVLYRGGVEGANLVSQGVGWSIPQLDANEVREFDVTFALKSAGRPEFTATASTIDSLLAKASVVTEVLTAADLKLEVRDPQGPQPLGQPSLYEIRIKNRGTAMARDIHVMAVCVPELEPLSASDDAAVKAGQIFFKPIPSLGPGQERVLSVTVRASQEGNHGFRVIVSSAEPQVRLASEEATQFFLKSPTRTPSAMISRRGAASPK